MLLDYLAAIGAVIFGVSVCAALLHQGREIGRLTSLLAAQGQEIEGLKRTNARQDHLLTQHDAHVQQLFWRIESLRRLVTKQPQPTELPHDDRGPDVP